MNVPDTHLDRALQREYSEHRRALMVRVALRAAAGAIALVAVLVVAGVLLPMSETTAWLRTSLFVGLGGAAIALALLSFRAQRLALDRYLELAETRFPELRSWLRNALDLERRPPEHGSRELASAVGTETAKRLAGVPLRELRPRLDARIPAWAIAGAAIVIAASALLAPSQTTRAWATLWNPVSAAPPVRLVVEPGSVTVTPGAALAVRARVWGTTRAPKLVRKGEPAAVAVAEGRLEHGGRMWRFDLSQLTRAQAYRVAVAHVSSPRYLISLAGEPVPVGFEMEYRAPGYARLPAQRGAATRGDLTALAGSVARMVVTFDRDLDRVDATLPDGRAARWTAITPRRWQGEVPVVREGQYELHAVAESGEGRFRYRVTPLPDAPPVLVVRTPEGDLDLPTGQQVPLEVLAQDDLGLSELRLEHRKDPAAPWSEVPLSSFGARPREARVVSRWDASSLALLPGEVASFRFVLFDDNAVSGRGRTVSPTFELRFPSLTDLYDRVEDRQDMALGTLEKMSEHARELQKDLDKLARQQPQRASPQSPQGFQRSEELKTALERQSEIGQKIDEAAQDLQKSLEQASERQAFDQDLMRKMKELSELMQQIQSQEFKDALKRMQDAMEQLDKRPLEQELPKWRQENQQMLANLERTIELLKKLREEEKLQSLAQRAEELKAQQDELNRQRDPDAQRQDPKSASDPKSAQEPKSAAEQKALDDQQKRAAEESESLAKETRESAEQQSGQDQEKMQQAAEEMEKQAAPEQREAADAGQKGDSQRAQQSGQKASQSLSRAAEGLKQMANQRQQKQSNLDLAAVRRAAQDLVSLQRSSEQNLAAPATPDARADRQTDLSEGTSRVADSLFALARQTPFITPGLAQSLGRAINQLSQSGKELSSGNRAGGEQTGRLASQSLNQAVLELRNSENSMCQGQMPGQSGGKSPGMQLGQVGEKQSDLNRQTQSIAKRLSQQMRMGAGDREQLERLANEQARIRQQLEQIQKDEEARHQLLGRLDQTQKEMKDVEEVLRSGATDGELEQKQQRILSRLLDAQRSLNRRDFDPQRESRPGEDIARQSPAELPADLLRENDRLRLDLLKAEADRYPVQYRAFVEAYLKSLNGSRR